MVRVGKEEHRLSAKPQKKQQDSGSKKRNWTIFQRERKETERQRNLKTERQKDINTEGHKDGEI